MSERNEHEHSIRFITTDYEELFRIPDSGTVLVTFPDRQFAEKCSYIDDYHMKVGSTVYHICQYAEILKQNGGRCEPEPETELAKAAWQLGHREYLMLERTDFGFRYEVLTKDFLSRTQGQLDRPEWTMNQAREYVLDLAGLDHRSRFAVSYDMVKQKSRDVLKSSDVRNIEWVDSKYYPGMRTAEHTLTCEIRGEPFRLAYEVSKHDDGEGFVIHSDGKDIWDLMPEPELEKLEFTLSRAVTFGHWKKDIDQAENQIYSTAFFYSKCGNVDKKVDLPHKLLELRRQNMTTLRCIYDQNWIFDFRIRRPAGLSYRLEWFLKDFPIGVVRRVTPVVDVDIPVPVKIQL